MTRDQSHSWQRPAIGPRRSPSWPVLERDFLGLGVRGGAENAFRGARLGAPNDSGFVGLVRRGFLGEWRFDLAFHPSEQTLHQ